MTTEPVSSAAAITVAVQATIAILLVAGVDPQLVAAIQGAVVGWVVVVAVIVRSRVTPIAQVALTVDDVEALTGDSGPPRA